MKGKAGKFLQIPFANHLDKFTQNFYSSVFQEGMKKKV